jgi:hypothetical protein
VEKFRSFSFEKDPTRIVEYRPESEARPESEWQKKAWLKKLAKFIVTANGKTWAADGAEITPEIQGYKHLEYKKGLWKLKDRYSGYFMAPGHTTVYYKNQPVWTMSYGGQGQTKGYENQAKQTFTFLKSALMKVTPDLPFRGPEIYEEGNKKYTFKMLEGDITDGLWKEEIKENGIVTFKQTGLVGLVINKDQNRKPVLPWKL